LEKGGYIDGRIAIGERGIAGKVRERYTVKKCE
jgi:hypothetical protein